jgi:formylglycine-generating enzyme required for sulfatase activity/arylsulfatase A-like enzyme
MNHSHIILALLLGMPAALHAADRERPNIVFFLIDDCSTHEFGCYGNKINPTPNVDRLAETGIRFNTAWATPLCMPTRALLLSGQYGFKTGVYDNGIIAEKRGDLPNKITPLGRTLQQAGYATLMAGKWHLEGLPGDAAWGFDEYLLYGSLCQAASRNPEWIARYTGPWWPWPGANRRVLAKPAGQSHPYATWNPMLIRNGQFVETGRDDFGPHILSHEVSDFIRRKASEKKSFFVYYAEHLTHAPHTSMRDEDDPEGETEPGMESNVRYVDRMIGRLVDTLKDTGVWENTVLMVGGDNPSDTMGKGFAAAIGAHVPLIVGGGKKWVTWHGETGCLTDFADVYPTCMELAGLNPATNPELSGRSFKPLLDGDRSYTRPWIFSYLGIYRMIRDRQWCLDGADQLWRCNSSGNPFTFELIPKDKEDAEAARGRAGLEELLKQLPAVPDRIIESTRNFAADREANRAGELSAVQKFQQLYRMGVAKLLANPVRKEGPTRVQIDARFAQPSPASGSKSGPAANQHSQSSVPTKAPKNMVFIPPGKFLMGSPANEADRYPDEGPQTTVTIGHGFWMGKYEVTQEEYLAVTGSNPSHFTGDLKRPVDSVTWEDATNYCAKLTERERAAGRIAANAVYRLPSEAEWEYACRAGTTTRFSYGDDPDYTKLTDYAWYRENAGFTTHPVAQKLPNPWGLYDMYGNVWEWCQDWYGAYPGGTAVDPQGPAVGGSGGGKPKRTIRGGDYFNPTQHCRSALRGFDFAPKHPWPPDFGFRVVLVSDSPIADDRPAQRRPAQRSVEDSTSAGQRNQGAVAGTVQERFDQMAKTLGLSDEQKAKLMDLQRAVYKKMGNFGGQSDLTPAQRMEQFKKFRAEFEQKVEESKILSEEQLAKWKQFQSQRFSGGGNAGGTGTMPKWKNRSSEESAPSQDQKPNSGNAPAGTSSVGVTQGEPQNHVILGPATPPAAVQPVENMVWIKPGTFTQGTAKGGDPEAYPDEYPQREVTISKGFWMGTYEVTQREYLAITGSNASFFDGAPRKSKRSGREFDFGGPNLNRPVDSVSWADAARYCSLLTERERAAGKIPSTWAYRLPTEAEWDYAIRAGTTTRYYFGDDPDHTLIKQYEWVNVHKAGQDPDTGTAPTQPVGQLKPNPWGLYDMGGNVWEWTLDFYAQFPRSGAPVVDPLSTKSNLQPKHALKGCGANSPPRWARSAARGYDPLDNKGPLHELDLPHTNNYTDHWLPTGFRIVLSDTLFNQ